MNHRQFLAALTCAVILCFTSTASAGTLGDVITITTLGEVDHYEVRVKEAIGFSIVPVSNPADDPDSDGDIVVAASVQPDSTYAGTISISKFLTGQPLGGYVIEAASVDANGQMSGWTTQNFTYSPPEAPAISVGFSYFTNYDAQRFYQRDRALLRRDRLILTA